jgi:hypothetical protein
LGDSKAKKEDNFNTTTKKKIGVLLHIWKYIWSIVLMLHKIGVVMHIWKYKWSASISVWDESSHPRWVIRLVSYANLWATKLNFLPVNGTAYPDNLVMP